MDYEIDHGPEPTPRARTVPTAEPGALDLDADRAQRLIEHRRRQDEATRDAQLALVARVDAESRVLVAILGLPIALAIPAGLVEMFSHWPAILVAIATGFLLRWIRRWRTWIIAPAPGVLATGAIAPEGWFERVAPGQERIGDQALVERRAALSAVNDAVRDLQGRRGIAWRQIGAGAVGWIGGAILPLFTGGTFSQVFIAAAGGAAACAAVAWVCALRQMPMLLVGLITAASTLTGSLVFSAVAGLDIADHLILALPIVTMITVFFGMGVGWWIENTDLAAPQRNL